MDETVLIEGQEPIIPAAAGNDGSPNTPTDPARQPQGPSPFDPTPFKFKYRDREIVPRDVNHVRGLMQKGYGFDQEMEGFKSKQREMEERSAKLAKVQELYDGLQSDPKFASQIFDLYNRRGQSEEIPEEEQVPPYLKERLSKVDALEKQIQDLSGWKAKADERAADDEIEKEIQSLKSQPAFKGLDWETNDGSGTLSQKVMRYALDRNIRHLDDALRAMQYDSVHNDAAADALKAAKEKRIQDSKNGIIDGGAASQPVRSGPGYSPDANYSERAKAAVRDLTKG